ncbi:hemolytic lectin LSLb [Auriscalpium vulgare]|uniref:Hemolytic lectin LSLb n=1 Tax=Auriscalpium vulgare TaxID=40419 RepID=A0ACB8RQX2_9AGAM|nr:hemolytic lectin LSLb [Auriscalpium vulgare]
MSDLYIPPNGLYFRLVGYASLRVLFSRTTEQPEVWHQLVSEVLPEQFFTLVPGTGARSGLYLIKSKNTNKVLFSRTTSNPKFGHVEGEGDRDDTWFRIEAGASNHIKAFRLVCPGTATVIISRVHTDPSLQVTNYTANGTTIDYDLNNAKVVSSTPLVLASTTYHNDSNEAQTTTYELDESATHTSRFEHSAGFPIALGFTFNGSCPYTANGEILVDSTAREWTFGEGNSFTKKYTASASVTMNPHKTVLVSSVVRKGFLEVPYTIHLSSKSAGVQVESTGIWYGATTWHLRNIVDKL